jgi:DNA-binding NarL/FixJ family response regulator
MAPAILLVDDQRDILRLLRSALDTLRNPDLEIMEAASAEAALQELNDRSVELLVTDYNLPGASGMDLMHRVRAAHPDTRIILITGNTDRKLRDEMLNAGALAVFSKPIPLGDFLDAVERGLGLARTILPSEPERDGETNRMRVSELLANLRQDLAAAAVLLISNRGLVVARAGDLRDSSMEVSLMSALAASFTAGLKVSGSNRQSGLDQYSVFAGGDQDLVLMPVDPMYFMVLAGEHISSSPELPQTIQAMRLVKEEVSRGLRFIGATGPLKKARRKTDELGRPEARLDALLTAAPESGMSQEELDAYWDAAATQHANKPMNKDEISYEDARKMGLTPGSEQETTG